MNEIFMKLKRACFNSALTKEDYQNGKTSCSKDKVYLPPKSIANFKFFYWKELLKACSSVRDMNSCFSKVGTSNVYKLQVLFAEIMLNVYFLYTPRMPSNFRLVRVEKVALTPWFQGYYDAVKGTVQCHPEDIDVSDHYVFDRYETRKIEPSDVINAMKEKMIPCTLIDNKLKVVVASKKFVQKYGKPGVVIVGLRTNKDVSEGAKRYCIVTMFLENQKRLKEEAGD